MEIRYTEPGAVGTLVLGVVINEKHKAKKFHTKFSNTLLTTLYKNVSAVILSQEVYVILYLTFDELIHWFMSAVSLWSAYQVCKLRKEKTIHTYKLRAAVQNLRFAVAAITGNNNVTRTWLF